MYSENNDIGEYLRNSPYFDKASDLIIEPGAKYKYSRISSDDVKSILSELEENRINTVLDQSQSAVDVKSELNFDGTKYRVLKAAQLNKSNALNINFDLYLDPDKNIGIQLFGTDYKSGLNIQNRRDIAPFHYYATEKCIYVLNNKFEIKHKFDLLETYNDHIFRFILGEPFDDVILISSFYFYILSYDLSLKMRFSFNDIKGIDTIVNGKNDLLMSYPYYQTEYPKLEGYSPISDVVLNDPNDYLNKNNKKFRYFTPEYGTMFLGQGVSPYHEKVINSKLGDILSKVNSAIWNNNLYIPIEQSIYKLILLPDCEEDKKVFDTNGKATIRRLNPEEYYLSFNVKDINGGVLIENDFIETNDEIKNLYFDKDGKLYAFNFDTLAISPDSDTAYGIYGSEDYIDVGGWYYIYAQSLSKMISGVYTSKYAEFASPKSIDKIKINSEGDICLIRGFGKSLDDNNEKCIEVYDKTKALYYRGSLDYLKTILSLDSYNYIDESGVEKCVFSALGETYSDDLYWIEYVHGSNELNLQIIENLDKIPNANFSQITNSEALLRYNNKKCLYFNLFLPEQLSIYNNILTHTLDYSEMEKGWYNINILADLNEGIFETRINDTLFKYNKFEKYINANSNIFDTTYYIGCLGKKYGTTMNKIINNAHIDPYICKNTKINNMVIFKQSLKHHEYIAMRLENKQIQPLTILIPCGTRNMVEEIIRYFRYATPTAISNKIKINISGTNLKTKGEFELLRKELMTAISENSDALMEVKEINFI